MNARSRVGLQGADAICDGSAEANNAMVVVCWYLRAGKLVVFCAVVFCAGGECLSSGAEGQFLSPDASAVQLSFFFLFFFQTFCLFPPWSREPCRTGSRSEVRDGRSVSLALSPRPHSARGDESEISVLTASSLTALGFHGLPVRTS